MNKLLMIALIWLVSGEIRGQSLTPSVIASTGNFTNVSGYSISATCGELVVTTATNVNVQTLSHHQ